MQFLVALFHRLIIISPAHYLEDVCGEDIFNSWVVKCHIEKSRVPHQLDTESKEQDPKSLKHISSAPISNHTFLFFKYNRDEIYWKEILKILKSISIVFFRNVWKANAKVEEVKCSFFVVVNLRNDYLGIFPNQGKPVRVFDENNLTSLYFVSTSIRFWLVYTFCLCLTQIISFR